MDRKCLLSIFYDIYKNGNYILEDPINKIVIDDIESFEIYLRNYKKLCYDSSGIEVSLSLFTATSFEEMRKLTKNSKDIKIIEELKRLAINNEFKINYDQETVKERNVKTAKSMLQDNFSLETISKHTVLTLDGIKLLDRN